MLGLYSAWFGVGSWATYLSRNLDQAVNERADRLPDPGVGGCLITFRVNPLAREGPLNLEIPVGSTVWISDGVESLFRIGTRVLWVCEPAGWLSVSRENQGDSESGSCSESHCLRAGDTDPEAWWFPVRGGASTAALGTSTTVPCGRVGAGFEMAVPWSSAARSRRQALWCAAWPPGGAADSQCCHTVVV